MSLSDQARKQANLRLLQRTCSSAINDIVQTATHVVLYEFICDAWQKSNIEGSLFLTQTPQQYCLVILNRHSTDNLQMDVTDSMQMQHQDPYLIFKERIGDATRIRGIWFHNADERVSMADALDQAIDRLQSGFLPPEPSIAMPSTPGKSPAPPPRPPNSQPREASAASASHQVSSPAVESAASLAPLLASMAVESAVAADSPAATSKNFSNGGGSPSISPPSPGGVALDKKSLQLALLSLIQDDRFLDLIHSQYLRVIHARVKKQQQQNSQPNSGQK